MDSFGVASSLHSRFQEHAPNRFAVSDEVNAEFSDIHWLGFDEVEGTFVDVDTEAHLMMLNALSPECFGFTDSVIASFVVTCKENCAFGDGEEVKPMRIEHIGMSDVVTPNQWSKFIETIIGKDSESSRYRNVHALSFNEINVRFCDYDDEPWDNVEIINASFKVFDIPSAGLNGIIAETLKITDDITAVTEADFNETISMSGSAVAMPILYIDENFKVIEDLQGRGEGVVSGIVFTNDLTDFSDSPPDYSGWKPLISGDYTYKKALIKTILKRDKTADKPLITHWIFNVDMPDVYENGTTTLTAADTFVTFTRRFYVAPYVRAFPRASTATAVIASVTSTGFTVHLEENGSVVAGTITWDADGY